MYTGVRRRGPGARASPRPPIATVMLNAINIYGQTISKQYINGYLLIS